MLNHNCENMYEEIYNKKSTLNERLRNTILFLSHEQR